MSRSRSKNKETPILPLRARLFLLWATPRGEDSPFEVTWIPREAPAWSECPSAPVCPHHIPPSGIDEEDEHYDKLVLQEPGCCVIGLPSKAECIRMFNRVMTERILFTAEDRELVENFLRAMGYTVTSEPFTPGDLMHDRRLMANSMLYNFHDVATLCGPMGRRLFLIRNRYGQGLSPPGGRR